MTEWTARDKLKEIERELKYRKYLYPKWIEKNQLTVKAANKQIGILEVIAADYRELVARDEDLLDHLERSAQTIISGG